MSITAFELGIIKSGAFQIPHKVKALAGSTAIGVDRFAKGIGKDMRAGGVTPRGIIDAGKAGFRAFERAGQASHAFPLLPWLPQSVQNAADRVSSVAGGVSRSLLDRTPRENFNTVIDAMSRRRS